MMKNITFGSVCSGIEAASAAWNEIKDRKGNMVEGGVFVKEGE